MVIAEKREKVKSVIWPESTWQWKVKLAKKLYILIFIVLITTLRQKVEIFWNMYTTELLLCLTWDIRKKDKDKLRTFSLWSNKWYTIFCNAKLKLPRTQNNNFASFQNDLVACLIFTFLLGLFSVFIKRMSVTDVRTCHLKKINIIHSSIHIYYFCYHD